MFRILALSLLALALFSCTEERKVSITDPPRGSMLPADQPVTLKISSNSSVLVNDEPSSKEVQLEPVDGLGFVKASIKGDPLFDVRSYHQGTFVSSQELHSDTMRVTLPESTLTGSDSSIEALIATLLTQEELEPYVENPLTMVVPVMVGSVTVEVTVTSCQSPQVDLTLTLDQGKLFLDATLHDVLIDYTAQATGISSSGTAFYETIDITGEVLLDLSGATLTDTQVVTSEAVITDSGGLPAAGVELLSDLFNDEISQAVLTAAENATGAVFLHLINNLGPRMGVAFSQPIESSSSPEAVTLTTTGITLTYGTQVSAQSPSLASEGHGVLERPATVETYGSSMCATFGPRLMNQYAFAAWDAGNMEGLSFTKNELEDLGMGELEFPYSNLNSATISLLLPPLLEATANGLVLMVGGIQIDLSIDANPDTTAWTAAEVPVTFTDDGESLYLVQDDSRPISIYDVGFNKKSDLVDQDKVLSLLDSAVPGVIQRIFSDLPAIQIEPMQLTRLDGSEGPLITLSLIGGEQLQGAFTMNINLSITQN